ncbi:MAG: transglutaminase family protein, partial [Solirubrobacteraceae bacterium]
DGAHNWFNTTSPFDAGRFPDVDTMVRLGFFVAALALGLILLWAGRAMPAVLTAFTLYSVPSTMLSIDRSGLRAAAMLAAALVALYACRTGRIRRGVTAPAQAVIIGAAIVAGGLVLGGAPGISKGAFLDWRHWNPLAAPGPRVSVGYVWDQSYGPLRWPRKKTVVFEVSSPRPMYWKAAVLDEFSNDHWRANPRTQAYYSGGTNAVAIPDTLQPVKALHPDHVGDIVTTKFTIKALADPHLLAPGQPLVFETTDTYRAQLNTDSTVLTNTDPAAGATYTVRSYLPDPTPTELADVGNEFPAWIADQVSVNQTLIPVWRSNRWWAAGQQVGAGRVTPLSADYMAASDQVWRNSKADEAVSEYAAVGGIEAYLRSAPFVYDQTPSYRHGVPVLVDFLTRSHHGYCQMFSGAMALVLRLHGIPARVAVGFTTGDRQSPKSSTYIVNNRQAHSWVEVYFPDYGWLPFDPTPTRNLPVLASVSNPNIGNVGRDVYLRSFPKDSPALAIYKAAANGKPSGNLHLTQRSRAGRHEIGTGGAGSPISIKRGRSFFSWLLLAGAVGLVVLAAFKLVAVRWRYLRRGPRAQASAAYHELATFAGDQGVAVGANLTFEDLAVRLRNVFDVDASAFAATASATRYAPLPVAERARRDLRRELRRVKRDLRSHLSRRDRLTGAVRLRAALSQTDAIE